MVRRVTLDVHWKLYELNGRFYRGRPKDGSMRTADLPQFLSELLAAHLQETSDTRCSCREHDENSTDIEWCNGSDYVFLGPKRGRFRRSNYSERVMRPAAHGWHPARNGSSPRPKMPVLVDAADLWPGKPLAPWPAATADAAAYQPPAGRGRRRITERTWPASWLPVLEGLSPHGLRHGHQTWMDEVGTSYVL